MTNEERQRLERVFNRKYAKDIRRMEEKCFILKKKSELKRMKKEARKGVGLTTTKLLCYYIFIIFNVVLLYALIAMWHFGDLSYLGVVISDILGQVLVYGIYSIRAYNDTKSEETMKLEREKLSALPTKAQEKLYTLLSQVEDISNDTKTEQQSDNDDLLDDLDFLESDLDDMDDISSL